MQLSDDTMSTRRTKSVVPEYEKDERYWERRKKNNIAAKRSRENKRNFDEAMRSKTFALEKVNMLLKKELSIVKSRFGIPDDHSMLTIEDQDEMKRAIEQANQDAMKALQAKEQNSAGYTSSFIKTEALDDFQTSPTCSNTSQNTHQLHRSDIYLQEQEYQQHNHLNITPTRSPPEIDQVTCYINSNYRYTLNSSPSGSADSGYDCEPTDLSMKRKRNYQYSTQGIVGITGEYKEGIDSDDNTLCIHEVSDSEQDLIFEKSTVPKKRQRRSADSETGLKKSELNSNKMTSPQEGEDLRNKLEALSEQVQSMYKLVYQK